MTLENELIGDDPFQKSCAGPAEIKLITDFPENDCKNYSLIELSKMFSISIGTTDSEVEICTCSGDGCNKKILKLLNLKNPLRRKRVTSSPLFAIELVKM